MGPVDPRVLPHLRAARGALATVVAGNVIGGLLLVGQAFAIAALLAGLIQDPGGRGWQHAAWALALVAVGRAAAGWIVDLAAARAADRVTLRLRDLLLDATARLAPEDLSGRRAGELGLLGTRGVAAVEPYLTRYLPALVTGVALPLVTLAAIATQDTWGALVVGATLPLVPVFAALIGMATRDRAARQWRTLAVLSGHFLDVVRGLPTLIGFGRADAQGRRIREITERYRRTSTATLRLAFASSAVLELVATISVALVAVVVGLRLAAGGLDLRTALVVLLLAPEAYWPLRRVGAEFHAAAEGTATFEAIDRLEQQSGQARTRPADASYADRVDPVPVQLTDLVVRYPGRSVPALTLDRARVPAPGLTAITGPSGCGKSTLLRTLIGEMVPTAGAITAAGEAIDPGWWRSRIAQVPQTPWLTPATIAANVRLGRPEATDAEVWSALAAVALSDTVAALPGGLDTELGDDGAGFSSGQRARLALARVVLANRPYVFLDEPTAHLDPETEEVLLRTLTRLARHATVVVVAHRPQVVAAADHLIELTAPAERSATVTTPVAPGTAPAAAPAPVIEPDPGRRVPAGLATLLGTLAALSGIALTATAGWLIARAAEHPPVLMLTVAIVGVRTFGLARPVLRYAERLVSHDVALRALAERRASVYDDLVPLVPARLGRRRGDLLTSVVDDVDSLVDARLRVRLPLRVAAYAGAVTAGVAGWLHPGAGLVVAAVAVLAGVGGFGLARRTAARVERAFVDARAVLAQEVVEALGSVRQLVLWQADGATRAAVRQRGAELGTLAGRSARGVASGRAVVTLATVLGVPVIAWACHDALAGGALSGPIVALLVLLPLALAEALVPLPDAGALSVRTRAAEQRLDALRTTVPAVTEPAEPAPLAGTDPVVLSGVSVGWSDVPVLTGVDLELAAGGRLTISGPSGCGKSTLAALLVRHLEPATGRYLLGGTDTTSAGSSHVRRRVCLVDATPHVFASTLRENLRLAAPDATDEDLRAALARAGLGGWSAALPHGLDTLLGEAAAEVSGGERTRIGLARALLADPDVMVLDEPTAHLDRATAAAVSSDILADLDRTLVWITHERFEPLVGTGTAVPGLRLP